MSFDHRQLGTAEAVWVGHLAMLPSIALPDNDILVLAAHPDDETLGAGGLISLAAAAGRRVHVVIATDGDASHPNSPTHTPAQLAQLRRREARQAVGRLAPTASLTFVGLPDGRLAEHCDELAEALPPLLTGRCLLVTHWSGDGHPDHEACAAVAAKLTRSDVQLWQFPIWAWHWGQPDQLPMTSMRRLSLDPQTSEAKRAALSCHVSQHERLSAQPGDEAILNEGMLSHFRRDFEVFLPLRPAASADYFDRLYDESDDPWGLDERFYEVRKRDLLVAALPRRRFGRAFEPGCATGLLTERLAARCDEVLAVDGAARAVELTRQRMAGHPEVTVEQRRIPEEWPSGQFDLIVLSEVGYYCDDVDDLAQLVVASLRPDGVVVACHWRHPAPDHPHTADEVHAALARRLVRTVAHSEADFLLEVFARNGDSVALTDGILG